MYRNGRPSSSRIGVRNYRTNSTYGNKWNPVNDSHPENQYDRYSPNDDYDRIPQRNTASQNYHGRDCYNDRRTATHTTGRYLPNNYYDRNSPSYVDFQNDYRRNSRYNDHQRNPSQPYYDREQDDVRSYDNNRHERNQDVGHQNHRYLSNDEYDRNSARSGTYRIAHDQNQHYSYNRRSSYSPNYNRDVRNHTNDGYSSNDDYDRNSYNRDSHYYDDRRSTPQPEYDRRNNDYDNDVHSTYRNNSDANTRCSLDNYYDRNSSRNADYRMAHDHHQHYHDDRQAMYQPHYNRHDDIESDNRYSSDNDYNYIPPRDGYYQNYDNRRTSHSPQRHSGLRNSDYGNDRDNQARQSPLESQPFHDDSDNRMLDFSNRKTTPPRWAIDGEPVTFTEHQRFQANLRKQAGNRNRGNYSQDYDEEEDFKNLVNKMKVGQRDREKLAEEMGFNDVPPTLVQPPQRGGIRRQHFRMPDFSNREQHQTTPPRWSIDGEPVTFTEYQRFQANLRRQGGNRNRQNLLPDNGEEEKFQNLVDKMKIGQRDREKLADEMGFNDIPPPFVQPPRRGGIRRQHN